jgi:hypothetical protein
MQTISKTLVCVVLLGLVVAWGSGRGRPFHLRRAGHAQGLDRGQAPLRLRRWREGPPGHPPLRQSLLAALGGDEEDEREQPPHSRADTHSCPTALHAEGAQHGAPRLCRDRHLPPGVPLHQMLCHLLI